MDTVDYEASPMRDQDEGSTLVDFPAEAGKVVSMIAFGNTVFVACEYGVFTLVDGKAVRLRFVREPDGR